MRFFIALTLVSATVLALPLSNTDRSQVFARDDEVLVLQARNVTETFNNIGKEINNGWKNFLMVFNPQAKAEAAKKDQAKKPSPTSSTPSKPTATAKPAQAPEQPGQQSSLQAPAKTEDEAGALSPDATKTAPAAAAPADQAQAPADNLD